MNERFPNEKNKLIIDLLEAKLLTSKWLLAGFAEDYPDDLGETGVADREKAYRIALAYGSTREFLELRRNIVQKILEGDSTFNGYYFKGQKCYLKKHLENELEEIRNIQSRWKAL